jgi:hypothetical protein
MSILHFKMRSYLYAVIARGVYQLEVGDYGKGLFKELVQIHRPTHTAGYLLEVNI